MAGGRTILSAAHCVDEQSRHDLGELYDFHRLFKF